MVKMSAKYTGGLHCQLEHGPSQSVIETDAPKDNMGKGERFSPTDLMGASLASCILTTMGIVAQRDGVSIEGATVEVVKEMITTPSRRVGALPCRVTLPARLPQEYREKMERTAAQCPVKKSLHPDIQAPLTFVYQG